MSNKYFLRDGRNFIINPETEDKPGDARAAKKVFLLTVNPKDLETDKSWSVEAIRALATGLVSTTTGEGGKRVSKKELTTRLTSYIADERATLLVASQDILENLELCGYNPNDLLEMLGRMHGTELANEIEKSILVKGYAPTTIVKTLLPDVVKSINEHYKGDDKGYVVSELRRKFSSITSDIKKEYASKVADEAREQRQVKFDLLFSWVENVLKTPEISTWKELSIALSLVTGRRMAEVHGIKTVFLTTEDEYKVSFEGQLKTKGRGDIGAYEIPTLVPAKTVIAAWEKLKDSGKIMSADEVNRKLSKGFSTELAYSIKTMFKASGVTQYKDLRDIYSAKLLTNKPTGISDNAYLGLYLGHDPDDINTSNSYQKLYLV